MLLALGGDGNREESAEKTERVGRETESAVKILEELLIFGYRKNASDIHMEPWEDRFVIRMRIDGMMTMVREFDKSMYQPLVTRAKVISGMDIAKKRVPQDGHFRETIEGIRLDMRTSVIPTIFGEKMVLRFLDRKTEIDHCGTFGMNTDPEESGRNPVSYRTDRMRKDHDIVPDPGISVETAGKYRDDRGSRGAISSGDQPDSGE